MDMDKVKTPIATHYVLVTALLVVLAIFVWPRLLVDVFGVDSPWTSYLYKYGFGAIFFFIGVFLTLKSGACNLKRGQDRFWFRFLILGFFWYLAMHGLWIVNALVFPLRGGG